MTAIDEIMQVLHIKLMFSLGVSFLLRMRETSTVFSFHFHRHTSYIERTQSTHCWLIYSYSNKIISPCTKIFWTNITWRFWASLFSESVLSDLLWLTISFLTFEYKFFGEKNHFVRSKDSAGVVTSVLVKNCLIFLHVT